MPAQPEDADTEYEEMIDYRECEYEVRDDIVASQNQAWRSLGVPGTWWTSAERIAIGEEVRASRLCKLCTERKRALSPNAVSGEHDSPTGLSPATVDAIHRIVTDPGRLTRRILEDMIDEGLTDGHYVELVSVVCIVTSIDGFARTIGAAPAPFPAAAAGEPSRERPTEAENDGYWVPTIPYEAGRGPELDLYDDGPFMPNVGRGLSLVPREVATARALMLAHYMPYTSVVTNYEPPGRPIDRMQIELVAARVSAKNDCFY